MPLRLQRTIPCRYCFIFQASHYGTRQTIQKNSMGFSPWENTEIPWDVSVLFLGAPQYFSQLCQFSSDFDVSYHSLPLLFHFSSVPLLFHFFNHLVFVSFFQSSRFCFILSIVQIEKNFWRRRDPNRGRPVKL
jgi:hypothetical protein